MVSVTPTSRFNRQSASGGCLVGGQGTLFLSQGLTPDPYGWGAVQDCLSSRREKFVNCPAGNSVGGSVSVPLGNTRCFPGFENW